MLTEDHEIKFNIGLFLATTSVEMSYEYFLGKDTSIGGTVNFDSDSTDFNGDFGFGAGNKWVTRSQRFSLEIFGGFGRNINPEKFQDSFMYRGGLAIGFRF